MKQLRAVPNNKDDHQTLLEAFANAAPRRLLSTLDEFYGLAIDASIVTNEGTDEDGVLVFIPNVDLNQVC